MFLGQFKHLFPLIYERYIHGILGLICAFVSISFFLKLEKLTFKEIGLVWHKQTLKKFAYGLGIGIVLALVMTFVQVWCSDLTITRSSQQNISTFILGVPAIVLLAFMEELAFRSYPFKRLNEVYGLWITQLIIAILFAVYHILMGWPLAIAFMGPGILSLVFGLAAAISKGVTAPTGVHAGVNLVLAIFVGKTNLQSLFVIDFSQKDITEQMIEANNTIGVVIHISVLVLAILATLIFLKRKNQTN